MRVVEAPLNRETIEAITRLIVERFQPEQIILFGSVRRLVHAQPPAATWVC